MQADWDQDACRCGVFHHHPQTGFLDPSLMGSDQLQALALLALLALHVLKDHQPFEKSFIRVCREVSRPPEVSGISTLELSAAQTPATPSSGTATAAAPAPPAPAGPSKDGWLTYELDFNLRTMASILVKNIDY